MKVLKNVLSNNVLNLLILMTYTAVGTILGFMQGGIAPILRSQGAALDSLFLVFLLYLPYGLSFVWAPLLDRAQSYLNYRAQIILGLSITSLLLFAMSLLNIVNVSLAFFWWVALVVNIIIASMDLALDGLSSLNANSKTKPVLSATKVAGIALGSLIGGGALVAAYEYIQLSGILQTMALLFLLPLPLMLFAKKKNSLQESAAPIKGLKVAWTDQRFRDLLWRTALLTLVIMALFNFNRLLLIDLGIPLRKIGLYLGILTPIGGLALAVMLPVFIKKNEQAVFTVLSVSLLSLLVILLISMSHQFFDVLIWVAICIGIICNGMLVAIGSAILGWAKSSQSATNYSLLYGLGRLSGIIMLVVLPSLITRSGWTVFYIMTSLVLIIAYFSFHKILKSVDY